MKSLLPVQILDAVHNSLYTYITEDGTVRFDRFTEKQREEYERHTDRQFGQRIRSSSNVLLDLISDTDRLELTVSTFKTTSQDRVSFDFFVDGVLTDSIMKREFFEKETFAFTAPSGRHRLTVYLPWCAETRLHDIKVDDAAFIAPVERGARILALGDSITQGYTADHPCQSYIGRLTRELDAEILNQGVGGYRFLKESLDEALPFAPDAVIVAYGTNDYSFYLKRADYIKYTAEYFERLAQLYPSVPIVAVTPIYRGKIAAMETERDYHFSELTDIIKDLCAPYDNITLLDGFSFYPHSIEYFQADHLHPNDIGFSYYAEAVGKVLKGVLYGRDR